VPRWSSRSRGSAISWMVRRLDSLWEAFGLYCEGTLTSVVFEGKKLGKSLVMQLRRVGTQEHKMPTFSSTLLQSAERGLS
jgi:hypothetical protein